MKKGYVVAFGIVVLFAFAIKLYKSNTVGNNETNVSSTVMIQPASEINTTISVQYSAKEPCNPSKAIQQIQGDHNRTTVEPSPAQHISSQTDTSPMRTALIANNISSFSSGHELVNGHRDMQASYKGTEKLKIGPEVGVQTGIGQPGARRTGLRAGAIVSIPLRRHFALQPGLLYSQQQGNLQKSSFSIHTEDAATTQSLNFPASIVYKFGDPDNCRFLVGLSPYVSVLLSAQDKVEISGPADDNVSSVSTISKARLSIAENSLSVNQDEIPRLAGNNSHGLYVTDNVNKLDWGIGGFAGFEFPDGFYFKAEMQLGLRNTDAYSAGAGNRGCDFLLSVGYLFNGKQSPKACQ